MSTNQLNIHKADLLDRINELQRSGQYADLTIVFKDNRSLHVHKTIVCSASAAIRVRVNALASTGQQSHTIDIKEFSSDTVDRMVTYLYQHDYGYQTPKVINASQEKPRDRLTVNTASPLPPLLDNAELSAHIDVYEMAERYKIVNLQKLAAEKFTAAVKSGELTRQISVEFAKVVTRVCRVTEHKVRSTR